MINTFATQFGPWLEGGINNFAKYVETVAAGNTSAQKRMEKAIRDLVTSVDLVSTNVDVPNLRRVARDVSTQM